MSLYRLIRTSALLTLAGRYRNKLFRIVVALAIALTTAWLYGDVALYLDSRRPDLLGPALAAKTVIIYGTLFYAFWQLRPGAWGSGESAGGATSEEAAPKPSIPREGPLDELLDKPKLKTRKEAILAGEKSAREEQPPG